MRDILSPLDGIRSPFGARRGAAPPGPTGNGLLWGAGNYLLWGASYLVWGATSTPEGTMLWDDGSHMLLWSGGNYSMVKTADDADTSVSSFLLMGA